MPDLPANPTPIPPPAPPLPIVLDYQRAQKAKRVATGGLLLMGIALIIFPSLFGALTLRRGLRMPPRLFLNMVLYLGPPILVGVAYVTTALLIRRNIRWAGWVALAMTALQAIAWLIFAAWWAITMHDDSYTTHAVYVLRCILFLLVSMGFIALVIEVWRPLREPQLWRSTP